MKTIRENEHSISSTDTMILESELFYERVSNCTWKMVLRENYFKEDTKTGWYLVTGSNRRHPPCKGGALPTELTRHCLWITATGLNYTLKENKTQVIFIFFVQKIFIFNDDIEVAQATLPNL